VSGLTDIMGEGNVGSLVLTITACVGTSLEVSHPVRHQTQAEIRRRFDLCVDFVNMARTDLKWSTQRICDELPRYLQAKLDGVDWVKPSHDSWITTPGGVMMPRE
jgi:hypothetical protein